MATLTRAQILKNKQLQRVKVNVPEWGGDVYVAELSTEEMSNWQLSFQASGDEKERTSYLRQAIAARTTVDKNGKRLFTDADIKELGQLSYCAVERIFNVSSKLNRILDSDQAELVKNSKKANG